MITLFLQSILSDGITCSLLAIGVFLTFKILDFADMTAEGSFLLGGASSAVCIFMGLNPLLATIIGLLAGGVCGFITGVLNRLLHIPKLLSGIITMTASSTIALLLFGIPSDSTFAADVSLTGKNTIYSWLDASLFKGWQIVIISFAVVFVSISIMYLFFGTEYGMAIRATGMNERMAKAQGINTTVSTIACVTISNAIIGLSGSLYAQIYKEMYVTSATGFLVVGLASILIGEAIFGSRSFSNSLASICLGSTLYFAIINIATLVFEMPTQFNALLYALLITLALCLPMIKKGFKNLFKKKEAVE